ncbi:hypothetical protein F4821DRAFT_239349, partial [Hypoxylon rubiginosum]
MLKDGEQPTDQVRFDLSKNRHRHHFHVRNIVTRQFRSIGRRLKRTGSSTFSIRSEFPDPPDSRERRLLARDSADIWPSSSNETPFFNTPESNISPVSVGNYLDPLAMASIIIATGELDRLTSRASLDQASRTSGSSTGFSHASPLSPSSLHSGSASPHNGASLSNSMTLEVPPTVPFNTPASSSSQSGVPSPISRPSQRRGKRRRAQRSHLSEVTTPDEVASPAEPADEFAEHPLSFSTSQIEPLPEFPATYLGGDERGMYPKPLAINRDTYEETEKKNDKPPESRRKSSIPSVSITPPDKPRSFSRSLSGFSDIDEAVSPPSRVSSIGKTPESMYGPRMTHSRFLPSTPRGLGHIFASLSTLPDVESLETSTEAVNAEKPGSAGAVTKDAPGPKARAAPEETVDDSKEHHKTDSCHPCTWSESQGEPGNSDPFCPANCLETKHSSRDSLSRPSRPMRENSADTILIHIVEAGKGAKRSSDDATQAGTH